MTSKILIAAAVAAALATPAFAQGLTPYYNSGREEFQEPIYNAQAPAQIKHQRVFEGRNAAVIRDQEPTVGTWSVPDRATALGN
jgi:hypothetical protein